MFFSGLSPVPFAGLATAPFAGQTRGIPVHFFRQKTHFKPGHVGFFKPNARGLPQFPDLAGFLPDQALGLCIKLKPVVCQIVKPNQPFKRHGGKFDKNAEIRNSAHGGVKDFSFMPLKQQAAHAARHFPFTFHGLALENIELVANVLQFVNRGIFANSFAKVAFQGAMDKQVRIPPDWRGKVAIGF